MTKIKKGSRHEQDARWQNRNLWQLTPPRNISVNYALTKINLQELRIPSPRWSS